MFAGDLDNTGILLATQPCSDGAGTDSLITDDRFDRDAAGETEVYTWNATTLSKGSRRIHLQRVREPNAHRRQRDQRRAVQQRAAR